MKMTPETPPEKRLDFRNLTRPNYIYCHENDSRNASRKEVGPSKSHPPKLAYIAMKMTPETPREKRLDLQNLTLQNWHILLCKCLQKRLEKRGWTFEISPGLMGIYCYENDSRNASRIEVGPSKSHSAKLAYIVMKMTQETPQEKRLDFRNLTLQNWHILL